MIIIIIGVSGCGKTTLGKECAHTLNFPYYEADSFHSLKNIKKMSQAIPLTDEDRWPWLQAIKDKIVQLQKKGESAIFSCSALKKSYREFLEETLKESLQWVYLKGSYQQIYKRMMDRDNHYFKANMLKSQFEDLEEIEEGLILNIEMPLKEKVDEVIKYFKL